MYNRKVIKKPYLQYNQVKLNLNKPLILIKKHKVYQIK